MNKLLLGVLLAPAGCGVLAMQAFAPEGAREADFEQPPEPAVARAASTKLREFFPESLLWRPEVVTDERGEAALHFRAADSITTWRVSAIASSPQGRLGFGGASFRAFQKFFVEPDLPPVLTQGDRIGLPVAVYNFLEEEQRVALSLVQDDWYELAGERDRVVRVGAKQATSVVFDLVARKLGTHPLTVEARGEAEGAADAVRRTVTVWPDGRERTNVINARVSGRTTLSVDIPSGAIPGTARLVCKCYPGIFGSVLDGLEAMLRKPHG